MSPEITTNLDLRTKVSVINPLPRPDGSPGASHISLRRALKLARSKRAELLGTHTHPVLRFDYTHHANKSALERRRPQRQGKAGYDEIRRAMRKLELSHLPMVNLNSIPGYRGRQVGNR